MILDYHGRPLCRAIGFVGGYVAARGALPMVDALYVVGIETPADAGDEEEANAAPGSRTEVLKPPPNGSQTRRAR
jgi:hypothetical protein